MLLNPNSFAGLCRARERLSDTAGESPSTVTLAREAGMSPFHFIRQFEALFGVTPHQFRIQARLDRAKALLVQGEMTVTDICMEVGMSSLGSFSHQFTRRVGATPSEYRRHTTTFDAPGCLELMGLAFRNFEEASLPEVPLQLSNANQTHQSDGG